MSPLPAPQRRIVHLKNEKTHVVFFDPDTANSHALMNHSGSVFLFYFFFCFLLLLAQVLASDPEKNSVVMPLQRDVSGKASLILQ